MEQREEHHGLRYDVGDNDFCRPQSLLPPGVVGSHQDTPGSGEEDYLALGPNSVPSLQPLRQGVQFHQAPGEASPIFDEIQSLPQESASLPVVASSTPPPNELTMSFEDYSTLLPPGAVPLKSSLTVVPAHLDERRLTSMKVDRDGFHPRTSGCDATQVPRASSPLYTEPMDKELVAAAGFNFLFTVATVSHPLKSFYLSWKAVHLISELACWGYCLRMLWMRRPLRGSAGDKFKPFVFQPDYVFSRMEEAYIWTWFCIMYIVLYTIMVAVSLAFHFDGSSLPGSRLYLICFPYVSCLPLTLAWDPICCTDIFKQAAERKGYLQISRIHSGYYRVLILIVFLIVTGPVLWMLVVSEAGVYSQYDYDLYGLYAVVAVTFLLLPFKVSGYARACHHHSQRGPSEPRPSLHGGWPSSFSAPVGGLAAQARRQASKWMAIEELPGAVDAAEASEPLAVARCRVNSSLSEVLWTVRGLGPSCAESIRIIAKDWRWMCALRPPKILFAFGFLSLSPLLWPVIEIPVTESYVSVACNVLAMCLMSATNYYCVFRAIYVDQEMVLRAAEKNHNIGSGLVFQTASLLNAMTTGMPLQGGYIGTEERIMQTAAISCRWDASASWKLQVQQLDGSLLECTIMVPRMQLYRALLVARRDNCPFVWMDTISIPQARPEDDEELAARKALVRSKLISTMTAVYATARYVLVLDTELGMRPGPDSYPERTWTLQECVMNPRVAQIHLDGTVTIVGRGSSRDKLSGVEAGLFSKELHDLQSYKWVLRSEEAQAALDTSPGQRADFVRFVATRYSAKSSDKAVALGQIFFQVLFESSRVAHVFMAELAVLIAERRDGPPVMLIDNSGWDQERMSGSGDDGHPRDSGGR